MKIFKIFLVGFSLITFVSCKFDLTPVGVYTGTYIASNYPITSGDGTLTITEPSKGSYTINFISVGNPDINITGILIERTGGLYPRFYYNNEYDYPESYPNISISYIQTGVHFEYLDTISQYNYKYIIFDGTK